MNVQQKRKDNSFQGYFLRFILLVVFSVVICAFFVYDGVNVDGRAPYASWKKHLDNAVSDKQTDGLPTDQQPRQHTIGINNNEEAWNMSTMTSDGAFGKPKEGKKYLLIYNNVPKCGSRSLASTIKELLKNSPGKKNGIDLGHDKRNSTILKAALETARSPLYISGHMPFVRLNRSDFVYINLIRDPADRFLSAYYFGINGDGNGVISGNGQRKNQTIDEYVKNGGRISSPMFYHFMEDTVENRMLRPEDRLEQCKRNIEQYYTLVGITEEFLNTMKLLDKLLPRLLPDIHKKYRRLRKDKRQGYSTLHKIPPSNETLSILRKELALDYDLYHFVKNRFNQLKKKFRINHR